MITGTFTTLVSVGLLSLSPLAATASNSAAPAQPEQLAKMSPVPVRDTDVICKTRIPTGSRLGGAKECRTRAEWAGIASQYRNAVDHMQQQEIAPRPN